MKKLPYKYHVKNSDLETIFEGSFEEAIESFKHHLNADKLTYLYRNTDKICSARYGDGVLALIPAEDAYLVLFELLDPEEDES